jgi:glutamyl-tRNA synthetase
VILSWENLYAYNRKILDPKVNRYFFVQNPIELTVNNVPKRFTVKLNLHPEQPERGYREYVIKPQGKDQSVILWVSSKDVDSSKVGSMLRLMELFNVKIDKANVYSAEGTFVSEAYEDARNAKAQLIHWVPVGNDVAGRVIMPDASVTEGVAEGACKQLKSGEIVQFERFGFVRIDQINKELTAYFAQK